MARNVFVIIDEIRFSLDELRSALESRAVVTVEGPAQNQRLRRGQSLPASPQPSPRAARKTRASSPKLRAFRVLQGRYLGALRPLTAQQRARVKKVKATGGYPKALKLAASLKK